MAQRRHPRKRSESHRPSVSRSAEPSAAASAASLSPGRRWLFRLAALIGLPCLLLVLIEGSLRVAGKGYATDFFVKTGGPGGTRLRTNPKFGYRFFPPALARTPTQYSFAREKPPGTYRILLFGESAALGDPQPAFGMGRYLQALLEARFPAAEFEVIPAAMTAINSHALREVARECRAYDADLWIITMGNNEMAGPFGAMALFGSQAPPLAVIRASLAFQRTRLGQGMSGWLRRPGSAAAFPEQWGGLRMFLDQALSPADPKREIVRQHFEANLRDMIEAGVSSGARVLLCTVAVNLTDCPPFASRHGPAFSGSEAEAWTNHVSAAIEGQAAGRSSEALSQFDQAAAIDSQFAELRYRQGLAALALSNIPLAQEHLQAACDIDALPFRTDSKLNAVTRQLAQEYARSGVTLLDAANLLNGNTPAGHNLFLDHVHFDLPGNELMARFLAEEVAAGLPSALQHSAASTFDPTEAIERRLALTDWNRVAILETMLQRLQEPPFTGQLNSTSRNEWLAGRISQLRDTLHPRRYLDAEDLYLEAIQRHPDDPFLQKNFAAFLEATDDLNRAVESWQRVSELLPDDPLPWFEQGRLLVRLGELDRAHEALDRSLELRPDLDEARLEIGQILYRQGKHEQALVVYEDLRRRNPGNARVFRHMADPLGALERRSEVIDCLTTAAKLKPDYWEARYLLGVELGLKQDFRGAQEQFLAVLQQRPDFILARVNLGVSYVRNGELLEARRQFLEALRLDPQNATARQHLDNLDELLRRLSEPKE